MSVNLAVLLDEQVERGGEMQIRRMPAESGRGSTWELIVWQPTAGQFPRVSFRVRGSTPIELLNRLADHLNLPIAD